MTSEERVAIIEAINKLVNIPVIGEKVEASLIGLIVDLVYPIAARIVKNRDGQRWHDGGA